MIACSARLVAHLVVTESHPQPVASRHVHHAPFASAPFASAPAYGLDGVQAIHDAVAQLERGAFCRAGVRVKPRRNSARNRNPWAAQASVAFTTRVISSSLKTSYRVFENFDTDRPRKMPSGN